MNSLALLVPFFTFAAALSAQWSGVSIAPPGTNPTDLHIVYTHQGSEALKDLTGARINGVGVVSIMACSPTGGNVPGAVLKLFGAQHGISWLGGPSSDAVLWMTAKRNKKQLVLDGLADIGDGVTAAIAMKLITASGPWAVGVSALTLSAKLIAPRLKDQIPDPTVLPKAAVPASVAIPAGGCSPEFSALSRFRQNEPDVRLFCSGWHCVPE